MQDTPSSENDQLKKPSPKDVLTKPNKSIVNVKLSQKNFFLLILVGFILFFGLGSAYLSKKTDQITEKPPTKSRVPVIGKFASEEAFKEYLQKAQAESSSTGLGFSGVTTDGREMRSLEMAPSADLPAAGGGGVPKRVSETNVQVAGIDEPDIVKTDGKSIFFSTNFRSAVPLIETTTDIERSPPRPRPVSETKIITAFPPALLAQKGSIPKQGNLLLNNDTLIVFSQNQILGFDVTNPATPTEQWKIDVENKNQIVTSRLFNNKLFVVMKTRINRNRPCPVPMLSGDRQLSIACHEIYRPGNVVPVDSTFTALSINPSTGAVVSRTTFVGSSNTSVVYVSKNAIYITYSYNKSISEFLYNFYVEKGQDLISDSALMKLKKLQDYDISTSSKLMEVQLILENYYNSLSADEQRRIENEMTNRMETYAKEHSRDLEKTGIVKINLSNFSISANGEIPGRPLNQFSLDEYKENLRIATTLGQSLWGMGESANDVYVLNSNLQIVGSVQNLGLTERIYSARFIEDKGYIVTFRRIDPFYVLDLSNPKSPKMKGELKIPGYSSYLHPITKNLILGIGEERNKVKISLFNVSSPANPREVSKYTLDEYWSEVANTHHAFLLDSEHSVFFLPGKQGGYIFSYKDSDLKLARVVTDISARRAIYINDYMYIIGDDRLTVLNENNWTEVNNLTY
jgi:uncharacterized secreted protein with C-terminal beta-propeller domain